MATKFLKSVATSGAVSSFDTTLLVGRGFQREDFDLIPVNQDLYACDGERNTLVKIPRNYFTNHVGNLLITDAGERTTPDGKIFIVDWNSATTNFVVRPVQYRRTDGTVGKLEHVTFSPIDFPILTP